MAIAVLVDEDVVEAAGVVRFTDASDFFNRRRIRQARHVEHDGAEVVIRSALAKLKRLHHVVAILVLEVLDVHATCSQVQVLVLDTPGIDALRFLGVADINDVEALVAFGAVNHAAHIGERTIHLLFEVDVGDAEARAEREVGQDFNVVASGLFSGPLSGSRGSRTRKGQNNDKNSNNLADEHFVNLASKGGLTFSSTFYNKVVRER